MSLPQLEKLRQVGAFDPTQPRERLSVWHVPFDTLCGDQRTERALYEAIRTNGRVVVMGGSGSGKSSMLAWTFREEVLDLALVRVPVSAEDPTVVGEPGRFAAHLVQTVARQARLLPKKDARRFLDSTKRESWTVAIRLGLPTWLATAGISAEIQSVAERLPRSAADQIEIASTLMKTISAKGLTPVLVVDDADLWLSGGDHDKLVNAFFTRVMRSMCDHLTVPIVVAAHRRYLELPGYQAARGVLGTRIDIPQIPLPGGVAKILAHRVRIATEGQLADVMEDGAVAALAKVYEEGKGSLRYAMLVAQGALVAAWGDKADSITERQVTAAIAELGPTHWIT